MKSPICEMLGIEFPLVAFTHCRDVVVEVSKAGGMGVLGAAGMSAEKLKIELEWIDDHIGGLPYGRRPDCAEQLRHQRRGPQARQQCLPRA